MEIRSFFEAILISFKIVEVFVKKFRQKFRQKFHQKFCQKIHCRYLIHIIGTKVTQKLNNSKKAEMHDKKNKKQIVISVLRSSSCLASGRQAKGKLVNRKIQIIFDIENRL